MVQRSMSRVQVDNVAAKRDKNLPSSATESEPDPGAKGEAIRLIGEGYCLELGQRTVIRGL